MRQLGRDIVASMSDRTIRERRERREVVVGMERREVVVGRAYVCVFLADVDCVCAACSCLAC